MTTTLSSTTSAPAEVRVAFGLWLGALATGIAEMALRWSETELVGIATRLGIYAVLAVVMLRMRAGRNWARLTLAIVLGIVGTLSLVIEPITWLLAGNDLGGAVERADATGVLVAVSRGLHLLCVLVAVPLMFARPASAFFRRAR